MARARGSRSAAAVAGLLLAALALAGGALAAEGALATADSRGVRSPEKAGVQEEPVLPVGGQRRQGGVRCPLRGRCERVRHGAARQKEAVQVRDAGSAGAPGSAAAGTRRHLQVLPEAGEEVRGLHDDDAD